MSDFANASAEIAYQPGLYEAIKSCRPDVLIGEGFFKWTPAAVAYRLFHGTPLVISYERTVHTERHSQWFRTAYRKAVAMLTAVVCCNGVLSKEYLRRLGIPESRIVTGAMAADSEKLRIACESFDEKSRAALRHELELVSPIFLYVGQLVKRKGVEQLLRGWDVMSHRLQEQGTLVIIGDGPERNNLEAFALQRSLKRVRFFGSVDYDDIAKYYAMSDVFVMPTLEDNWSLVVPEAMACGLPIICSVYNGCWPELVQANVNGITFDPLDPNETAESLEYFLKHSELIKSFGEASRRIESEFSPEHAAQAFYEACERAYGLR